MTDTDDLLAMYDSWRETRERIAEDEGTTSDDWAYSDDAAVDLLHIFARHVRGEA